MAIEKQVYMFREGASEMRSILGDKGSYLAEMTKLGLPVPQGFTISSQVSVAYFQDPSILNKIKNQIENALKELEKETNKIFGSNHNPLLLSVRSGASVSMPGMMDTVLNVGMNDHNLNILIKNTNNEQFVLDTYRRFIQMYSDIVMGIDKELFDDIISEVKKKNKNNNGTKLSQSEPEKESFYDLTIEMLREVIESYKNLYREILGEEFPQDPKTQLYKCIEAVFNSFNRPRAKYFRQLHKIPDDIGTAVNIQEMVFGNFNNNSMTGTAVSRDPITGENKITGEYLINAQGEDVLNGIVTPKKLETMKKEMPNIYKDLTSYIKKLENHFKNPQEIEFTVQDGKIYLLQTRTTNCSASADLKITIDMLNEGLINKDEAILRIDPNKISQLLFKRIDRTEKCDIIAKGIAASPGAVTGRIVFNSDDAERSAKAGKKVILVTSELRTDDFHGLIAAEGMLSLRGGKTSHVAVVARGLGKPLVCGVEDLTIDIENKILSYKSKKFYENNLITIDGSIGLIVAGQCSLIEPESNADLTKLLAMIEDLPTIKIRANADTPQMAHEALKYGATGIGLCRTEHLFSSALILELMKARSYEERKKILEKVKPIQKENFKKIFEIMNGLPVVIRLFDPPISKYLPDISLIRSDLALLKNRLRNGEPVRKQLKETEEILMLIQGQLEANPDLGLRGCRIDIKWPEINQTICYALFEAASEVIQEGKSVKPEILIPLVSFISELKFLKESICNIANKVAKKYGVILQYKIGNIIETPRCALNADEFAQISDFLSFGTNDLTQMTLGFSRDDTEGKFLTKYIERGIIKSNPFEIIDEEGPGKLILLATEKARKVKPSIELGISGEHGGNPESIDFFYKIGLDYSSCSPYRIPAARIAAAQSYIKNKNKKS